MKRANIVCLLHVENGRASFKWSEGAAFFEPYVLEGMPFRLFKKHAEGARQRLSDLVKDCEFRERIREQVLEGSSGADEDAWEARLQGSAEFARAQEVVCESSYALAEVGYQLYEQMFRPSHGDKDDAAKVRRWLEQLRDKQYVDTLEIVMERAWTLPWNVIYDHKPDKEAFFTDVANQDVWRPFWGIRYNLVGGRPVDPLRRLPLFKQPHVLMVVDPAVLPPDELGKLTDLANTYGCTMVSTRETLEAALENQRPDVLYWLSHATPEGLVLGQDEITPEDLYCWMMSHDQIGGLAFLNACQTAEEGQEGSFFEALHNAGFSGMVGTEQQTYNLFANRLGMEFLETFLGDGQMVGEIFHRLRSRVPLGLVYGTYCPPHIKVETRVEAATSLQIQPTAFSPDAALGTVALSSGMGQPAALPESPYRSLSFYDYGDRSLFAGRGEDIQRFAAYFDDVGTRLLVLHGESGVGKSSFLRAGVIPYLEDDCRGYRFLRDVVGGSDSHGSVLFVRATNDLFGQLAQALQGFCASPYEFQTPLNETVSADLPSLLEAFTHDHDLAQVLRDDSTALMRILQELGAQLPFSVVLVIDQAEELFTLAQEADDMQRSREALEMLRRTVHGSGNFKVILSLRTEYCGRLVTHLRRGLHDARGIREYLLTDFNATALVEAITRPTLKTKLRGTTEVPYTKYGFSYATGVAEEIARRVIGVTTQRGDSVLPLVQVICTQLYEQVRNLPHGERLITLTQLERVGGVEGAMRRHVQHLMKRIVGSSTEDEQRVKRLFTRLFLRQADGSLTTALMPVDELARHWNTQPGMLGAPAVCFERVLAAAEAARLVRVNAARRGDDEEQRYVSLGHDVLAKLAAEWDDEFTRDAKYRKVAGIVAAVGAVAVAMGILATIAQRNAVLAKRNYQQAERNFNEAVESLQVALAISETTNDAAPVAKTVDAYDQVLSKVAELAAQRPANDQLQTAKGFALNAIGRAYDVAGKNGEALKYYDQSLQVRQQLAQRRPGNRRHQRLLANAYMNRGQVAPSEDHADLVLAQTIRQQLIDAGDTSPELLRDLAMGYLSLGSDTEAIDGLRQLLEQSDRLPTLHPDELHYLLARGHYGRAVALRSTNAEDALAHVELANDALKEIGNKSPGCRVLEVRVLHAKGELHADRSEWDLAAAALEAARVAYGELLINYTSSLGVPANYASAIRHRLNFVTRELQHAPADSKAQ